MCVMRNTKNTPRDSEVENNNSHAAAEANVWTKKTSNSDVKKTMSNFFLYSRNHIQRQQLSWPTAAVPFIVLAPWPPSTHHPYVCCDLSAKCQRLAGVWEYRQLNKMPQVAPDVLSSAATVTNSSSSLYWGSHKEGEPKFEQGNSPWPFTLNYLLLRKGGVGGIWI